MTQYVATPDLQKAVEEQYSRKNVRKKIEEQVRDTPVLMKKLVEGEKLLSKWLDGDYYPTKNQRIDCLREFDLERLVMDIFITVLPLEQEILFTSAVGMLVNRLGYTNHVQGLKTAGELLAVLAPLKVFLLARNGIKQITIKSAYRMPTPLKDFIKQTKYLPPLICPPKRLKNNMDSAYYTVRESVILGKGNHHENDVCLEALNTINNVPLKLNVEMLQSYNEACPDKLDTEEKRQAWKRLMEDSYEVFVDLVKQGNQFWLSHKYDKRGRVYAQGYHCSTQGNSFRKAIIQFHDEELVTGVPNAD